MRLFVLLVLTAVVAGCTSPGGGHAEGLDTGVIEPQSEKALTFDEARVYELHCDPHPFMTHNVTAEAGAPTEAHVPILDGNATSVYRFDPHDLRVAPGARVTYHNHGTLPHTASEMTPGMEH